jgi:hypothetical protein
LQELGATGVESREHGANMRLNPRSLGFRDQLLSLFPRILLVLIDHPILPDDDDE